MKKDTSSSFRELCLKTRQTVTRCTTPNDLLRSSTQRIYTPYPLYKQKIRVLLRPPDYQKNPPIFMSIREPRSEFEKKEASTQVKLLKKTFNTMFEHFNSYGHKLNSLKSEAIRVNALKTVGECDLEYLQNKIDDLESKENKMLAKICDENDNNIKYKHVRERLRQTLMHLEVKNQYLKDQIRLRDLLLESTHRKKTKTLENKFTKATAYRQLQKTILLDIKDRTQDINILKEDIEAREKIHELRKTRLKNCEEIAETAANELRDSRNNSVREGVLVNIFYAKLLDHKLMYEKKKYAKIENAFQKIKAVTVLNDVEEIIARFLTKEQRLDEMMANLDKNKNKSFAYVQKNEQIEKNIDEILLHQKAGDVSIKKTKEKVHQLVRKVRKAKDMLEKVKSVHEKVKEWTAKQLKVASVNENFSKIKLKTAFGLLHKAIKQKIMSLKKSPFITEI
ncbi:hypothetical protein SteCoe_12323 [Stentor coeruleus]|uniref:DUF4201 domain-containing protein n=1 Tax=Stentor coeruleus TaxID=5963 RepID=A0A1R2CB07_9CILI|nr:hypothetical protein SteCoe_12323 [Stentor coeruleus]